jgi:hypothetical protein
VLPGLPVIMDPLVKFKGGAAVNKALISQIVNISPIPSFP